MGWAERAKVGVWTRAQQRLRRERLTRNLMPRLILWQLMHLVVALALWPMRFIRWLWRSAWTT